MAPALGLQAGVFPALVLNNHRMGQVFPYKQNKGITAKGVDSFVLGIVQGKTKPAGAGAGAAGAKAPKKEENVKVTKHDDL